MIAADQHHNFHRMTRLKRASPNGVPQDQIEGN